MNLPALSRRSSLALILMTSGLLATLAADGPGDKAAPPRWRQHDNSRPRPAVVEPAEASIAARAPKDAIVLFDGSGLDAWKSTGGGPARWRVVDGAMETAPGAGAIETRDAFGDVQLHLEWAAPSPPRGKGQDRGNSGVFLMGEYEVQVLDSFNAETYADGQAGALYGQYPPLFNASRPPGEWQSYDIAFRRPRFGPDGALVDPARMTVFHNGILIQNNEELFGPTSWLKWLPYSNKADRGAISLQDHDHPVRYRNIWLRQLPERAAPSAASLARPLPVVVPADLLDRYAGEYVASAKPNAPTAKITREADHLVVVFPFRPQPLAMYPISETEFDMPFTDGRFTFRLNDSGKVTGVAFRVGDAERLMKRVGVD